jgi:pantoate--beta-alanine ligase
MGFFHEGHLSLMRRSTRDHDRTAVSIFVNPTQFGPQEDFTQYPKNFGRDKSLAQKQGVDIIFYPSADEMYPQPFRSFIQVEELSDVLCGKFRPGHFRGVATVVGKLLNIVQPDTLYLGQKDFQQCVIIRLMIRDLNFPVQVRILPTVREPSGLAMSSRNKYLSKQDIQSVSLMYTALLRARQQIVHGERLGMRITTGIKKFIEQIPLCKVQYATCVSADELTPLKILRGNVCVAVAVYYKKVRLIDNILVRVP